MALINKNVKNMIVFLNVVVYWIDIFVEDEEDSVPAKNVRSWFPPNTFIKT